MVEVKAVPDSCRTFFQYTIETTSYHGLPKVYLAPRICYRILWALLFVTSTTLLLVLITMLTQNYMAYPVKTDIKLHYSALRLPSITICNENPLRRSFTFNFTCKLQHLLGHRDEDISTECGGVQPENSTSYDIEYSESGVIEDLLDMYCDENDSDCEDYDTLNMAHQYTDIYMERKNILYEINQMDMESRIQFGHQKENLIIGCSFRGVKCNLSEVVSFLSAEHGNCFTFQYLGKGSEVLGSGPNNGLELILNLEIEEYLNKLNDGYGVKVILHEEGSIPLPSVDGVDVTGGQASSFSLKLFNLTRLGGKYGECSEGAEFIKTYNRKYTEDACRRLCISNATYHKCGCYPTYATELINYLPPNRTFCNQTKSLCEAMVDESFVRNELKLKECSCPYPCNRLYYESLISTRTWPSFYHLDALETEVCRKNENSPKCFIGGDIDMYESRMSFAKVNIFYKTLNHEIVNENPFYDITSFISNIGGTMGLMIGFSVLSLAELIEIVIECIIIFIQRLRRR